MCACACVRKCFAICSTAIEAIRRLHNSRTIESSLSLSLSSSQFILSAAAGRNNEACVSSVYGSPRGEHLLMFAVDPTMNIRIVNSHVREFRIPDRSSRFSAVLRGNSVSRCRCSSALDPTNPRDELANFIQNLSSSDHARFRNFDDYARCGDNDNRDEKKPLGRMFPLSHS